MGRTRGVGDRARWQASRGGVPVVNYDSLGGGWKDVELVSERVCFWLEGVLFAEGGGMRGKPKEGGGHLPTSGCRQFGVGERSFEWVVCQWSRSTTIH
jgi:hypothetical protein